MTVRPVRSNHVHCACRFGAVALAALLAALTAGCKTNPLSDATGAFAMAGTPPSAGAGSGAGAQGEAERQRAIDYWAERYRTRPNDAAAALNYAQVLRASGQRAQAVAVLEHASIQNPKNTDLLAGYGRALADVGNYQQALDVLNRAHTPDRPDWRILSVQGAALDQMGRHEDAQRYYASALKIAPREPSVLSNLGLSYALSKELKLAEETLRPAAEGPRVDPRVRQNLALVVGLQGRFDEAEAIARADLPAGEAAANVAYLRQMLATQQEKPQPARPARAAAGKTAQR